MDKLPVSIISFVLGWLISQLTSLAKYKWQQSKLRDGLLTELDDINNILQRSVNIYGRSIQIIAKQGINPTTALPVPNMFFQQYFKDAFGGLNREQRISYQLIHALLGSLNKKNEDLGTFFEEHCKDLRYSTDKENDAKVRAEWKERVTLLYKLTQEVRWHIVYHLSRPGSPVLDHMGPVHKRYLEFLQELDGEVEKIIEGAASLTREDLENGYDTRGFSR